MAPTTYEPDFHKFSSPTSNSASPLSPNSVSLKPNVNRAKTKRWVEAKQYSYDGNDWGDEEDEEYEEEPPAVPPQPASNSSQKPGDRPSMLGKDRSRSTDQVLGVDPDDASGNRSQSADRKGATAPFVRPADIYKRMREDREKDGLPAATRGSTELFSTTPPRASAGALQSTGSPISARGRPGVADGKRLSGINTDLAGGSSSGSIPIVQEPEEQRSLQHNPSLGFRSAVNQAFDVPETPASTADSVGRSNSDSTSAVSPIMTNRGYSEGKTPTIAEEEPGEMTPKEGSDGNIIFKPGHRRDLSVPSPSNSPSRTPNITDNETPASAYPQISSSALGESAEDPVPALQQNKRASVQFPGAPAKDLPAPLRFTSNQTSVDPSVDPVPHHDTPAVVVPSLSTETSPQDSENDRLRKEIIKTLSRENSPPDGAEQGIRDSIVPSEYETYWSQDSARSPEEQRSPEQNAGLSSEEKAPSVGPPPAPWQGGKPKLAKKFSWESSEGEDSEAPNASSSQLVQDPPIPGQLPPDETATPPATGIGTETETKSTPEKPKLTIIPPSAGDESSIMSGRNLPELVQPEAAEVAAKSPPNFAVPSFSQEPILGFRDILGIKSTDERVRQFDRTRTQFESIDTGLSHWIQVSLQTHPEHGDIAAQNAKLSVGAPKGRAKFPKLPSFSNFGATSSGNPEGPPPGHGHVRRTSAPLNKQQVEQRGKEILHTAGMLGGRAGEAAKGFFARGRSKLKGNGEKVQGFFQSKMQSESEFASQSQSDLPDTRAPSSAGTGSSARPRSAFFNLPKRMSVLGLSTPRSATPGSGFRPGEEGDDEPKAVSRERRRRSMSFDRLSMIFGRDGDKTHD